MLSDFLFVFTDLSRHDYFYTDKPLENNTSTRLVQE